MKTYVLATITCPDRPGVVDRVTAVAVAHGANWEESRMTRLGGDFAGIVRLAVAEERAEELMAALRALADDETSISARLTREHADPPRQDRVPYVLRLTGADHEGIVSQVARYLAQHGVNVEDLETDVVPAPVSGTPLFRMEALLLAPSGVGLNDLRARLRDIGEELAVDIEVEPAH
jgi:glycine cleavage system regulatory protein